MSTAYENATLTTYIPCTLEAAAVPTVELVAEETCDAVVALPALASITANSILATACSCMGNPVPTTTITETVNAPAVQATTTDVAGTPKTTTLYALTLVTQIETVAPLATVAVSSATTLTSYATVSLTAPTFAPVFDPKAGCAHVNVSKKQALPPKIKSLPKAIEKCQAICEQESSCKSVYVQHMFENWSGKTPHYVCEMSEKFLKPRRDLRCGKKESIFGKARGFDAQGRGV